MIGDGAPKGTYSAHEVGHAWSRLIPGKRYRIIKPFKDFDGDEHPIGETWT